MIFLSHIPSQYEGLTWIKNRNKCIPLLFLYHSVNLKKVFFNYICPLKHFLKTQVKNWTYSALEYSFMTVSLIYQIVALPYFSNFLFSFYLRIFKLLSIQGRYANYQYPTGSIWSKKNGLQRKEYWWDPVFMSKFSSPQGPFHRHTQVHYFYLLSKWAIWDTLLFS